VKKGFVIALFIIALIAALGLRFLVFSTSAEKVNVSGDESISALQGIGITQSAGSIAMQAKQNPRGILGRFPLLFMGQPYMFPCDAYMNTLFIRMLPHTAFGIRLIPMLMGLIAVWAMLLIFQSWTYDGPVWPGVALVLFPSAYLILIQNGYSLPGYASLLLLMSLVLLSCEKHRFTKGLPRQILPFIAAVLGGIACSTTLLALPLLIAAGVMFSFRGKWKETLITIPIYLAGAAIGLLPYFYAKHAYPGAHAAITATVPLAAAIERLWTPAISYTLPLTFGYHCTIIPDAVETVGVLPIHFAWTLAILWLLALLTATAFILFDFMVRTIRHRWPSIMLEDVALVISAASVALFIFSSRFGHSEFRYLLPAVWVFPLIVGYLYRRLGSDRTGVGIIALILVALNIATSLALVKYWRQEDFDGVFNDVRPAIDLLHANKINRCYASYFDAYTINYLSEEEILCSQPLNERYPGWPLPYKQVVDNATNVAYVLGPSHHFKPEDLEYDMKLMHITCRVETAGQFKVYSNFKDNYPVAGRPMYPTLITAKTKYNPEAAAFLSDGKSETRWQSHYPQEAGAYIDLRFPGPVKVTTLKLYYGDYPHDRANALRLRAKRGKQWITIKDSIPEQLDSFDFSRGYPIWGNWVQTIRIPVTVTDAIRLEITEPREGRDWTINEITVYVAEKAKRKKGSR